MDKIAVLKDVAYGAKVGGGTIAGLAEVGLLQPGAMAVLNPSSGVLLAADGLNAAAAMADTKDVVLAFGRNGASLLVTVPRNLKDFNRVNYRAFVKPVITVGGTSTALALPFENEGDVYVKVIDTTYSSRFGIPSIRADVYKTPSMTPENVVDAVVAKLNASTQFGGVTATKVNSGANFGITITPKETDLQIEVAVGGMWQGASNVQTTDPVYGIGSSDQILKQEKNASAYEGNGNYIDYTAEFFSQDFETVSGTNYDQLTLIYDGYHQGATTKRHVALRSLVIATVNGGTVDADAVVTILGSAFPNYTSETEGQEIVGDDGTDKDGVAGN